MSKTQLMPVREMDPAIISSVLWLCRNAYPKPVQSDKFPGTEVFSISRADIPTIRGVPLKHLPYVDADIDPWLVPPLRLTQIPSRAQQTPKVMTFDIQLDIDASTLASDLDATVWPTWSAWELGKMHFHLVH